MPIELLFVHALSPLHAGTGQSVGAIELAIARDQATGLPYLPGTSLKGALRDRCRQQEPKLLFPLFGPDTEQAHEYAGALIFGDANLLLLPVRSLAGTFAWVTSPYLLARLRRDCQEAQMDPLPPEVPMMPARQECVVAADSILRIRRAVQKETIEQVIFEDLDFRASPRADDPVGGLARWLAPYLFPKDGFWQRGLRQRLCVVHDDVMSFLSQHATDVVARVALHADSKTVENLWHEESLPVETVLVALVCAARNERTTVSDEAMFRTLQDLMGRALQLGGKATVGRGRCRLVLSSMKAAAEPDLAEQPRLPAQPAAPPPPTGPGPQGRPPGDRQAGGPGGRQGHGGRHERGGRR